MDESKIDKRIDELSSQGYHFLSMSSIREKDSSNDGRVEVYKKDNSVILTGTNGEFEFTENRLLLLGKENYANTGLCAIVKFDIDKLELSDIEKQALDAYPGTFVETIRQLADNYSLKKIKERASEEELLQIWEAFIAVFNTPLSSHQPEYPKEVVEKHVRAMKILDRLTYT